MFHHSTVAVILWFSALTVVAEDAVVFLKTFDESQLESLVNLPGTVALYRIQRVNFYADIAVLENEYNPGYYEPTVWNLLLLGEGFDGCAERDLFINDVASHAFVKNHKSVSLTGFSNANEINKRIEEKMNTLDLMKRPLKQAVYNTNSSCSDMEFDDGMVFTISMSKTRDETARREYTELMLDTVFPALGIQYFYTGSIDSTDNLDTLTILEYFDKQNWCEYAFSKFVQNSKDQFKESFEMVVNIVAVLV